MLRRLVWCRVNNAIGYFMSTHKCHISSLLHSTRFIIFPTTIIFFYGIEESHVHSQHSYVYLGIQVLCVFVCVHACVCLCGGCWVFLSSYVPPGHGLPSSPLTESRASFCSSSTARTSLACQSKIRANIRMDIHRIWNKAESNI